MDSSLLNLTKSLHHLFVGKLLGFFTIIAYFIEWISICSRSCSLDSSHLYALKSRYSLTRNRKIFYISISRSLSFSKFCTWESRLKSWTCRNIFFWVYSTRTYCNILSYFSWNNLHIMPISEKILYFFWLRERVSTMLRMREYICDFPFFLRLFHIPPIKSEWRKIVSVFLKYREIWFIIFWDDKFICLTMIFWKCFRSSTLWLSGSCWWIKFYTLNTARMTDETICNESSISSDITNIWCNSSNMRSEERVRCRYESISLITWKSLKYETIIFSNNDNLVSRTHTLNISSDLFWRDSTY